MERTIEDGTGRWDVVALDDLVTFAGEHATTGLVVTCGGEVVVEAHQAPSTDLLGCELLPDGRTREDVASAQKSVTALLVSIAIGRGLLALDDPVVRHLGPGWTHASEADEARITVRHLMTMTSGLDDDLAAIAEPGTVWQYNLGPAYHSVKRVVSAAAGQDLAALGRGWLFDPLGLDETAWQARPVPEGLPDAVRSRFCYPDGQPFEALHSTTRDLVRLGRALLDGDVPGLPDELLRACWSPATDLNPAYGLLWWCNGQPWHRVPLGDAPVDGWLVPTGPADLVSALGAFGRSLQVSPDRDLVVARLGGDPGGSSLAGTGFNVELWRRLTAADRTTG